MLNFQKLLIHCSLLGAEIAHITLEIISICLFGKIHGFIIGWVLAAHGLQLIAWYFLFTLDMFQRNLNLPEPLVVFR